MFPQAVKKVVLNSIKLYTFVVNYFNILKH